MSASKTNIAPTARQLRFLRSLAQRTGVTFVSPKTRREASNEINRLLAQSKRRRGRDAAEYEPIPDLRYGTAARPDEIAGYGSSAHWSTTHLPGRGEADKPDDGQVGRLVEQGRYQVSAGERVIYGQRVAGRVRLIDRPADGEGRGYVIERNLQHDGFAALQALVADYIDQAGKLDAIPAGESVLGHDLALDCA